MLNDYKKKFIMSNMILVGSVLFLMLAAIFFYSCHRNIADLRATMAHLTEPFESGQGSPGQDDAGIHNAPGLPDGQEKGPDGPDQKSGAPAAPSEPEQRLPEESPESEKDPMDKKNAPGSEDGPAGGFISKFQQEKNISVFFYDMDSGELSLLSKPLVSDENALRTLAEQLAAAADGFGKIPQKGLYFYKRNTGEIVKIAIADRDFIRNSNLKMLAVTLAIFLGAMSLFYAISRIMAKFAVRPLEQAITMEQQFVADASHDLKTPLAVVLANMSVLRRSENASAAEMKQWIEGTETAAKNMQALIEEMLALSRLDANGHEVDREHIDISQIAEMVALFLEPVAYEKDLAYEVDLAKNIHIWANEEYVKRIFQILIENAVKYEDTGGKIRISLAVRHGKAIFQVNNENAVISREELPHIFERFYRADRSRSGSGGHGLGLAIAKRMTDLMDGTIEAASSEREGTIFRVSFPLHI